MSSWLQPKKNSNPLIPRPKKDNTVSITVCVNYADKLLTSLEFNTPNLKKLYVVTDPSDDDTINLCKGFRNVEVILCRDVHKNGAQFNKSGLIKFAQLKIYPKHTNDWIIILDADTIIPLNFWNEPIRKHLDFNIYTLYLMKRKLYLTIEDLAQDKYSAIQYGCGFFQMYFSKRKFYGDFSESAAECDALFQQLFRDPLELQGFCLHLGEMGKDWNGRVTATWGS
jgi:glycosyltransferase involved in cell wall biosynthesis